MNEAERQHQKRTQRRKSAAALEDRELEAGFREARRRRQDEVPGIATRPRRDHRGSAPVRRSLEVELEGARAIAPEPGQNAPGEGKFAHALLEAKIDGVH